MSTPNSIRIGGASGFWGDAALATPQLLNAGDLDFIVYDYLAEVTLSIMARARAADPSKGYATDFVSAAIAPNLATIAEQGVKIIANAGGVNPTACADAVRKSIQTQDLPLRVAVVTGDDLMDRAGEFVEDTEMFSGDAFPDVERIASINAYLGAFPIAAALDAGADIVITGRGVDSAVTLGACIHAFGWQREDLDKLAQGSLAGHILECGTQATGGNFTDWESIGQGLVNAGYPIAEVSGDGSFTVSKPKGTDGLVSPGTVGEQMLYEIGNSAAYELPDVICDFSQVTLTQQSPDVVAVAGARGRGRPNTYKASATWADGFRAGQLWSMVGRDAARKAELFADSVFTRSNQILAAIGLEPLTETSLEVIGAESHFGAASRVGEVREVDFKIAVKHASAKGVGVFLKEMVGLALTAPPGLASFAGARAKPMPVVRLFSMLVPKQLLEVNIAIDDVRIEYSELAAAIEASAPEVTEPPAPEDEGDLVAVSLETLAFGRSGDKGNKANVGIMARHPDFLPWIAQALTEERIAEFFSHFLKTKEHSVERFYLPGTHALNFLLHDVLGGGGVASLRSDPQGKGYAQLLLTQEITIPRALTEKHELAC